MRNLHKKIAKLPSKGELERLKLYAEVQEKKLYKNPVFWGTITPLVLALSGILVASWFGVLDIQKANREAEIASYDRQIKELKKETEDMSSFGNLYSRGAGEVLDKKYEKAIDSFNKALETKPDDKSAAFTYNYIGLANTGRAKFREAIESYTKAIDLYEEYAVAYINRGNNKMPLGDYENAFEDFKKAAELYIIKGEYEKAKVHIEDMSRFLKELEQADKKYYEKMKKSAENDIAKFEKQLEEAKKERKEIKE